MGWGSGSLLFSQIIENVEPHVADVEVRKNIYRPLIDAFRDMDWDTYGECLGEDPAFDEALKESLGPERWAEEQGLDEEDGDDD